MACSAEPGCERVGIWTRPLPVRTPVDDCGTVVSVVEEGDVGATVGADFVGGGGPTAQVVDCGAVIVFVKEGAVFAIVKEGVIGAVPVGVGGAAAPVDNCGTIVAFVNDEAVIAFVNDGAKEGAIGAVPVCVDGATAPVEVGAVGDSVWMVFAAGPGETVALWAVVWRGLWWVRLLWGCS